MRNNNWLNQCALAAAGLGLLLLAGLACEQSSSPPSPANSNNASSKPAGSLPAASSTRTHDPRVLIFVAASTIDAITDAAKQFDPADQHHLSISSGASGSLARQIVGGAPADIFLSASPEWSAVLKDNQLASKSVDLLGNELVFVVPRDSPPEIKSPGDLVAMKNSKIAVADESAPVGKYAHQWLTQLGCYDPLTQAGQIVRAPDVRAVLAFAEHKDVQGAIVYSTDAAISKQLQVRAHAPASSHDPILYPLVLTPHGAADPLAVRFFEFLISPAAHDIYTRYGFTVIWP
jgi:molybdate transport system substrate-binding protein